MIFPVLKTAFSFDHIRAPNAKFGVNQNSRINEIPMRQVSVTERVATVAIYTLAAISTVGLLPAFWIYKAVKKVEGFNKAVASFRTNLEVEKHDLQKNRILKVELIEVKAPKFEAKEATEAQKVEQAEAIKEFGLTPEMVGLIYHMTEKFMEVAEMFGVNFIANGGTHIGAMRHQGMIPWDDDADLQLLLGEESKLADPIPGTNCFKIKPEVEKALAERGMKMVRHWGGWKLCPIKYPDFARVYQMGWDPRLGDKNEESRQFCFPFVDVFISKKWEVEGEAIKVDTSSNSDKERELWKDEWFPDVPHAGGWIQFGPLKMPVAYSTIEGNMGWVDRVWGKNWTSHAKIAFNHKTGKPVNPRREFALVDYSAPEYSKEFYRGVPENRVMSKEELDKQVAAEKAKL